MTDLTKLIADHVVQEYKTIPFVRRDLDGEEVDTTQVLTASETYNCIRSAWYDKNDHDSHTAVLTDSYGDPFQNVIELVPHAEDDLTKELRSEGYFDRGHEMEAWWVKRMEQICAASGGKLQLYFAGEDQATMVDEENRVAGTPDGVLLDHNNKTIVLIELKSNAAEQPTADPKHRQQTLTNMVLITKVLDLPEDYDVIGHLIYVNTSNWLSQTFYEYDFAEAEGEYGPLVERAWALFNGEKKDLPYEGLAKRQCSRCRYKGKCWADFEKSLEAGDDNAVAFRSDMEYAKSRGQHNPSAPFHDFSARLEQERGRQAALEYAEASVNAKEWEKIKEENRKLAMAFLAWEGNAYEAVNGEDGAVYGLSLSYQDGRVSADTAKMKKDGIFEEYSKEGSPFGVIRVTEK